MYIFYYFSAFFNDFYFFEFHMCFFWILSQHHGFVNIKNKEKTVQNKEVLKVVKVGLSNEVHGSDVIKLLFRKRDSIFTV